MDKPILSSIFCIANNYKRYVSSLNEDTNISKTNGVSRMIISFICESKEDVYQKTLENHFGFSRSTASNIITQMENDGLVLREKVNSDQRLKRLILTDNAIKMYEVLKDDMIKFESIITKDFTKEELKSLNTLLNKLTIAMGKE